MNETSSRSHAVLTLLVTQREIDTQTQLVAEKVSSFHPYGLTEGKYLGIFIKSEFC